MGPLNFLLGRQTLQEISTERNKKFLKDIKLKYGESHPIIHQVRYIEKEIFLKIDHLKNKRVHLLVHAGMLEIIPEL